MQTALQVFEAFWDNIAQENFEQAVALAAPNFELDLPQAGTLGLEAAIGAARQWKNAFSNFGSRNDRDYKSLVVSTTGREVAVVLEERLLHTGEFMMLDGGSIKPSEPPTAATINSIHVFQIDEQGRMIRWYIAFDPMALANQLQ